MRVRILIGVSLIVGLAAGLLAANLHQGDALALTPKGAGGGAKTGGTKAQMVRVPAGWFFMGCNDKLDRNCDPDEKPGHRVYLNAYQIDKHEVTVGAYRACVNAGTCTMPSSGSSCNYTVPGRDQHPINCVTWHQARQFCRWAGKDLPSEAQWEKASRGTDGRVYPWGNQTPNCSLAVMGEGGIGCGTGGTMPVCSKPRGNSPYGACDMTGNVMEWVIDPQDKSFYARSPSRNPVNDPSDYSQPRCVRGGERSYTILRFLRSSNRDGLNPKYGNYGIGFRCAK